MDIPKNRQFDCLGRVSLGLVGRKADIYSALRHRYNIPISLPPRTASSGFLSLPPSRTTRVTSNPELSFKPSMQREEPIKFDPAQIAKREEGWEDSLEGLIRRWIDEVVREVTERSSSGSGSHRPEGMI